jgi:hypothetical protein
MKGQFHHGRCGLRYADSSSLLRAEEDDLFVSGPGDCGGRSELVASR